MKHKSIFLNIIAAICYQMADFCDWWCDYNDSF